jgi:hypothetical protein
MAVRLIGRALQTRSLPAHSSSFKPGKDAPLEATIQTMQTQL